MVYGTKAVQAITRSLWRLRGWDRAQRIEIIPADPTRTVVIFCTWRRLERLQNTLDMLTAQSIPVQAMIWDNSGRPDIVAQKVADARIPAVVHHNKRNIGGFGRFYLAKAAAESGHKTVVFVDDDQEFGPTLVSDLLSAHRPRSISGWWAFTDYESRNRAVQGQESAYVGTCGMVADSEVFTAPRLFTCPRHFWFLEDRWLCHVAAGEGYNLYRSPALLIEIDDGQNQALSLGWLKKRFSARYSSARLVGGAPILDRARGRMGGETAT